MGFDTTVMVRSICLRHFDQVSENKKNVIEPTLNLLNQTVVNSMYKKRNKACGKNKIYLTKLRNGEEDKLYFFFYTWN
jgi:hypothetical protein